MRKWNSDLTATTCSHHRIHELNFGNKASQRKEGAGYPLLLPRQPFLGGEQLDGG